MAGSEDDGRTALNFRAFVKKTGIERSEHVPAQVAVDPDAAEDDRCSIVEEDRRGIDDRTTD